MSPEKKHGLNQQRAREYEKRIALRCWKTFKLFKEQSVDVYLNPPRRMR